MHANAVGFDVLCGALIALELAYCLAVLVLLLRLAPPSPLAAVRSDTVFSPVRLVELVLILLCVILALPCCAHALDIGSNAFGLLALSQFFSDALTFALCDRIARIGLKPGVLTRARGLTSSLFTAVLLLVLFPRDEQDKDALLIALASTIITMRLLWWFANPIARIVLACQKRGGEYEDLEDVSSLDEVALLKQAPNRGNQAAAAARTGEEASRVYLAFPDNDEENVISQDSDALSASLLDFGPPSFIAAEMMEESERRAPVLRSSASFLRAASPDIFPLPMHNVTWGPVVVAPDAENPVIVTPVLAPLTTARDRNEDALGLPQTVELVSVSQVFTQGGVPLKVYVLRVDRRGYCVHRYGDFRALHKRFLLPAYSGTVAPHFPPRRLVRKLLPSVLGGYSAEEDEAFAQQRARELQVWIQTVLAFLRDEERDGEEVRGARALARAATCDFLRPLLSTAQSNEEDEHCLIQRAVERFSQLNA